MGPDEASAPRWCNAREQQIVVGSHLPANAQVHVLVHEFAGSLENAAVQEGFLTLVFAINQGGMGPFLYRMAPPEEL